MKNIGIFSVLPEIRGLYVNTELKQFPPPKIFFSIHRKSNTISENKSGLAEYFGMSTCFSCIYIYLFIYCFQGSQIEAENERGRRPLSPVSFKLAFGSRELNPSTRHVILLKSKIYLRRRAKNNREESER